MCKLVVFDRSVESYHKTKVCQIAGSFIMPATTEDSRLSNLWWQQEGATIFYTRKTTLGVGVRGGDGDEKASDIPKVSGFCESSPAWRQGLRVFQGPGDSCHSICYLSGLQESR